MKWVIEGTDHEEEATETGWRRLSIKKNQDKSLAAKKIVLEGDDGTIHDTINTITAARKAGLLGEEGAPKGKLVLTPEGMVDYTLSLPATAFALYDMAKSFGLIKDDEMGFDQWVYECIDRRFIADYKVEIVMQPVTAQRKESMREMIKEVVKEVLAEGRSGGK
jgi:hypothetical protein